MNKFTPTLRTKAKFWLQVMTTQVNLFTIGDIKLIIKHLSFTFHLSGLTHKRSNLNTAPGLFMSWTQILYEQSN